MLRHQPTLANIASLYYVLKRSLSSIAKRHGVKNTAQGGFPARRLHGRHINDAIWCMFMYYYKNIQIYPIIYVVMHTSLQILFLGPVWSKSVIFVSFLSSHRFFCARVWFVLALRWELGWIGLARQLAVGIIGYRLYEVANQPENRGNQRRRDAADAAWVKDGKCPALLTETIKRLSKIEFSGGSQEKIRLPFQTWRFPLTLTRTQTHTF